jgi:hypothetical protein
LANRYTRSSPGSGNRGSSPRASRDRIGYIPEDAAFDRPTHEVNGCPIARGYGEDTIVSGLVDMIESEL